MKKLLLLLFLIPVFAAAQKTTGGNYTYIAQRYEDFTRLFQALNLPAGDSAQHKPGQDMRRGAVYLDTVNTQASPAGFYIYKNGVWELQDDNSVCQNRFIDPITVTYTGTGMKFFVSGGRYQIGCNFYSLDSATLTLSDGGSDPRKDVFYLDATGAHVLEGEEGVSPIKPQVDGDKLELTFVDIAAAATTPAPGITTVTIYDENTEWAVTNSGTTTDPDNTTNVYRGTKSLNVTNINNGDIIHFTNGSTVNVRQFDAIGGFIDLKAVMSGAASLRLRFFNGPTVVSNEVTIAINRQSTNWQAFSVPISSFTFSGNSFADRVNIRYIVNTAVVHPGYYLDFLHFETGLIQPGSGAQQLVIGPINGAVSSADGAVIENGKLYNQSASQTFPGLMSAADKTKLDSMYSDYFIIPVGDGEELVTQPNDSTVGIKTLKAGTNVTLDVTDTTITVNSSGGGVGNLIVQPLGSGVEVLTPRNDTLYHRAFKNTATVTWDTSSNGEMEATAISTGIGGTIANTQVAVGSGTNTIAGSSGLTYNGTLFSVNATAAASTAEQIIKTQVSDDANSYFSIDNGTTVGSRFSPMFTGEVGTNSAQWGLFFKAQVTAGIDAGTLPVMIFDSRRTTAALTTRPMFYYSNFGSVKMLMTASGSLGIGTGDGTSPPDRLLHSEINDATTNTAVYPLRLSHTTSGTNANGSAVGLEFENENPAGAMKVTGVVGSIYTDVTSTSEDADIYLSTIRAGSLAESFRITSVGGITVNGSAGTAGQVLTSGGTGAATTWSNPVKPTLTKNATIENPTASENMGWFRTPVAITITNTHAVLVGSSTPSVTYQISFGTDITSLTNVYTAGQTVISTTTGTAASGVNDATIPADSWIRITTSAQSGTVGQISLSITYTED